MAKWHAVFVVAVAVVLVNATAREIPSPKASPGHENANQTNLVHVPDNAIPPNNTDSKNATTVKDKKCLIGFAGVGGIAGVGGVIPHIPLGAGIGGVGGGVGGVGGVGGLGSAGGLGGVGGLGGAAGGVGGIGGIIP